MVEEKILTNLEEALPSYPHVTVPMAQELWEKQDKPYVWSIADKKDDVSLLFDSGHGHLVLVIKQEVVDIGKDFVANSGQTIIGLSEYYGLPSPKLFYSKP